MATLVQWFLKDSHMLIVQTVFFACQAISIGGMLYVHFKVTGLSKLEPPKGREWPKEVPVRGGDNITKSEYDEWQSQTTLYSALFSMALALFVHWYWEAMTPLLLSAIIGIKNMHDRPLFKIHVMGHSDRMYCRPFGAVAAPPPLHMMFTDSAKYMELMQAPQKRIKSKKLSGREKREARSLEKARAGKL
jgi:hypothetical protein